MFTKNELHTHTSDTDSTTDSMSPIILPSHMSQQDSQFSSIDILSQIDISMKTCPFNNPSKDHIDYIPKNDTSKQQKDSKQINSSVISALKRLPNRPSLCTIHKCYKIHEIQWICSELMDVDVASLKKRGLCQILFQRILHCGSVSKYIASLGSTKKLSSFNDTKPLIPCPLSQLGSAEFSENENNPSRLTETHREYISKMPDMRRNNDSDEKNYFGMCASASSIQWVEPDEEIKRTLIASDCRMASSVKEGLWDPVYDNIKSILKRKSVVDEMDLLLSRKSTRFAIPGNRDESCMLQTQFVKPELLSTQFSTPFGCDHSKKPLIVSKVMPAEGCTRATQTCNTYEWNNCMCTHHRERPSSTALPRSTVQKSFLLAVKKVTFENLELGVTFEKRICYTNSEAAIVQRISREYLDPCIYKFLSVGDCIVKIGGQSVEGLTFLQQVHMIKSHPRPLELEFVTV